MNSPTMLDLFSGSGSASAPMLAHGWNVTRVDLDPKTDDAIRADVREFRPDMPPPDLLWASPPCDEFARESMPWCKTGKAPDMSCLDATLALIAELRPRFWVIENVRGAVPWFASRLGPPKRRIGSVYLWGEFPFFLASPSFHKQKTTGSTPAGRLFRARIPEQIPQGLAAAIEAEQQ